MNFYYRTHKKKKKMFLKTFWNSRLSIDASSLHHQTYSCWLKCEDRIKADVAESTYVNLTTLMASSTQNSIGFVGLKWGSRTWTRWLSFSRENSKSWVIMETSFSLWHYSDHSFYVGFKLAYKSMLTTFVLM